MSAVMAKAFDAGKKIIKSIFKGYPNLITSADLNRQIEAVKYQLDQLDEKTGVVSDIEITHSLSAGTLTVGYSLSYLRFKGCEFSPDATTLETNLTLSAPTAYLCLVAEKEVVTYDSDVTHDIAGAKFVDGTSMPAANQEIYKNEQLILTHALSNLDNFVGVIAVFTLSTLTRNVVMRPNIIKEKDSLSMSKSGEIVDFDPTIGGRVGNGRTYDEAFSILENRFSNVTTDWTPLVKTDLGEETATEVYFRLQNGVLYLNMPETNIKFTDFTDTNVIKLGDFPRSIKHKIADAIDRMGLTTYNKFMSQAPGPLFIPYGEFGSFLAYSNTKTSGSSTMYPSMYFCKLSLILKYEKVEGTDEVNWDDFFIGAYFYGGQQGAATNEEVTTYGQLAYIGLTLAAADATLYLPRMVGAIPLFNPN